MSLRKQALRKLTDYIEAHKIISKGDKILVACSGGADSVALLYLLYLLRYRANLSLLVIHIDHQTRPGANEAETELVKELCNKLNVALVVRKVKPAIGADFENRARDMRFKEFELILRLYRFDKVALGHHKNDQAETLLMNLMRGAGINGASGIKPVNGQVIHPLLDFSRDELRELLRSESFRWAEDESNLDNSYRRNYLRNELIPQLEESIHPQVVDKLCLHAAISNETEQFLRAQTLLKLRKICLDQVPGRIDLDLAKLKKLSKVEQYYLLHQAYSSIAGTQQDFFWQHFEDLRSIFSSDGSKELMLRQGILARKVYNVLQLLDQSQQVAQEKPGEMVIEDDRTRTVFNEQRFAFKHIKVLPSDDYLDPGTVILDADKLVLPLSVRTRQPGDRFMPKGMQGMKKLKDFFIDEKVPKYDRDKVAILCDSEKILWIAGMRADQRALPSSESNRFLQVSVEDVHAKPFRAANRNKKQGEN